MYNTLDRAGDKLVEGIDAYRSGNAARDAMQVQSQTTPEEMGEAGGYGADKQLESTRYGLGATPTEWRDTAPTNRERRAAGLEARADYWNTSRSPGAGEKADAAYERIDAAKTRSLQQTAAQNQLIDYDQQKKLFSGYQKLRGEIIGLKGDYLSAETDADKQAALQKLVATYNTKLPNGQTAHLLPASEEGGPPILALTSKNGMGQTVAVTPEVTEKLFDGALQHAQEHFEGEYGALGGSQYMGVQGLQEKRSAHAETVAARKAQTAAYAEAHKDSVGLQKAIYAAKQADKAGYAVMGMTDEDDGSHRVVYQQPGKIGFYVDNGKGEPTRYTGDVSKVKGIGGLGKEAKPSGPLRTYPPEVEKAAAAAYDQINPADTAAVGAFDAKYPGFRASITGTQGGLNLGKPKAGGGPARPPPPTAEPANPSGLPAYLPQGGATPIPLPEGMDSPDAWRAFMRGGLYGPGGLSGR